MCIRDRYLTEHFASEDATGSAERLIGPTFPGGTSPNEYPRNAPLDYAGSQSDGRFSDLAPPGEAGLFDPLPGNAAPSTGAPDPDNEIAQFILHGGPYGPSGTEAAPNCQAGQFGYPLGQALLPGQPRDNPAFGLSNISAQTGTPPLGRTDLFLRQDGGRIFWDSP